MHLSSSLSSYMISGVHIDHAESIFKEALVLRLRNTTEEVTQGSPEYICWLFNFPQSTYHPWICGERLARDPHICRPETPRFNYVKE